ncbi:hypothetical protein KC19_4G152800 [Ceratodon purpureus]|uniref:NB-ARC domain-containing protein n=1 Tax=Ceratodon purpureus TaxID=3225 RepID=A0A8T0IAZ7_CERPU|nr:hypothetical protein KC19_4G152800 [Ceratodon purpureus]
MADRREYFVSSYIIPRYSVNLGQREVDLFHLLNDIPIVGLVGMSGIGKTALASLFFQARRGTYEKCCFLENVRSRHIEDVQRQLLFDLSGTVDWDKSKYGYKIRQCITTMRVLIIMDDIGSDEELAALQLSAFRDEKAIKKRSKAIVTGQDWQVLQDYVGNPGRVQVGTLDDLDGMALFSYHAFDGAKVDRERQKLIHQLMVKDGRSHKNAEHHPNVEKVAREFEQAAMEIVHECAGLPLSLQIVGDYLGKKKNSVGTADLYEMYKEALYKLRHGEAIGGGKTNDKLWSKFWQRYHDLERAEREMFIDFACFGSEDTTGRMYVSRDTFLNKSRPGSPRISLQNLIDKSFILVKAGNQLSMHNHLRHLGRKIARDRLVKDTSEKLRITDE